MSSKAKKFVVNVFINLIFSKIKNLAHKYILDPLKKELDKVARGFYQNTLRPVIFGGFTGLVVLTVSPSFVNVMWDVSTPEFLLNIASLSITVSTLSITAYGVSEKFSEITDALLIRTAQTFIISAIFFLISLSLSKNQQSLFFLRSLDTSFIIFTAGMSLLLAVALSLSPKK